MNTTRKIILKRASDFLEKLAVGSVLVGLFQGQFVGFVFALLFMIASYYLTVKEATL